MRRMDDAFQVEQRKGEAVEQRRPVERVDLDHGEAV